MAQVVEVQVDLKGGQRHVEAGEVVGVPRSQGQVPQLRVVVQDMGTFLKWKH